MDLLILVAVLVIIGFGIYALTTYVPMPPNWAKAIQLISFIMLMIYLMSRLFRIPNILTT